VVEPIHILVVGRATRAWEGQQFPVDSVALSAARDYLAKHVPELEFGTSVVVDTRIGEGSGDLQDVFGEEGGVPMANDTSFGVGHAPLTETETVVLNVERRLVTEYAAENPAVGPDIKVMGKREADRIDVTVAAATIDRYLSDVEQYRDTVTGVREFVDDLAREYTDREVGVEVNTADDFAEGVYLSHRNGYERRTRRRRLCGPRKSGERTYHPEPSDEHGGDERQKSR